MAPSAIRCDRITTIRGSPTKLAHAMFWWGARRQSCALWHPVPSVSTICRTRCGDSGIRTRVQTRNQYAFYTLILAFVFVQRQDPSHQPLPYLLLVRMCIAAYPCYSVYFRATYRVPKELRSRGCPFSFQPTDSAWSDVSGQYLVPTLSQPTVLRFRQRELHCCCQLLFYRHDLRASLQCSACLHTYSTCCQNQLSPYTTNSLLPVSRLLCSGS